MCFLGGGGLRGFGGGGRKAKGWGGLYAVGASNTQGEAEILCRGVVPRLMAVRSSDANRRIKAGVVRKRNRSRLPFKLNRWVRGGRTGAAVNMGWMERELDSVRVRGFRILLAIEEDSGLWGMMTIARGRRMYGRKAGPVIGGIHVRAHFKRAGATGKF